MNKKGAGNGENFTGIQHNAAKARSSNSIFRNKETGDYDEYGPYQPQFTNKEHKVKSKQKQRRDRRKKRKNAKQAKNASKNKPEGDQELIIEAGFKKLKIVTFLFRQNT